MNIVKHATLSALVPLIWFAGQVLADTTWIGGANGDIGAEHNWSAGLPDTVGNVGLITNGTTVEMNDRHDLDELDLIVSNGSTLHAADPLQVSRGFRWDGSTVTLDGGHLDVDYTEYSAIGRDSGGPTTLNINAKSTANFAGSLIVGRISRGRVNQSGGSMVINGTLRLQDNSSPVASGNVYHLSAGTVVANGFVVNDRNGDASNYFNFPSGSTGTLTIIQSDFDFEAFVADGAIRINDNPNSSIVDFVIDTSMDGKATRVGIPEFSTYALFVGVCALALIVIRRRR